VSALATDRGAVVVGVDLGTTSSKALVRTPGGEQLALVEARTPWTATSAGGTQTDPEALVDLTVGLLGRGIRRAQARAVHPVRVIGVGVTGLAESGVLLDGSGVPCAPVVAWFDRRGAVQVARIDARDGDFARAFVRRTGLPWDSQASVAKLLWFADQGLPVTAAHRWLSVPEYVVHRLGGERVHEPSLASRTGLLDQATGQPWTDGAAALGLPTTLLPDALTAGMPTGRLAFAGLPVEVQGAALTVAGHDHPAAAIGAGATGADELFNSSGTADVVARSLPGGLSDDARERLVGRGLSAGAHVLPDTTLLIGGVRGGLLLRRVLGLLGATDAEQRHRLDVASLAVGPLPAGLEVSGAGPTGDDVVLRVRDDVDPASVWAAAVRYTAGETRALLDVMHQVVPPHSRAVACGGWTRMASVREARSAVIDHLEFSPLRQPGVVGAALLAWQAAGGPPVHLVGGPPAHLVGGPPAHLVGGPPARPVDGRPVTAPDPARSPV
jgi:sugar (pentulose or hexulose) kinase